MATVELRNVHKQYNTTWAVDRATLTIPAGSFFSLLGPSGSGKTTLLRLVAGFLKPDIGDIYIGGMLVNDVPPHRRNIGMVFQQYALFPHRTVLENVAFGLEMKKCGREERRRRAGEALEMVQMRGRESAFPRELSGGQQQRVAIARSIAARPSVWLLDEPLSALDRKLRVEMQTELRSLQRLLGITTIYVTHDQEEALAMSDEIAIFRDGRIAQHGSPQQLYNRPLDSFVADFLGSANLFDGTLLKTKTGWSVDVEGHQLPISSNFGAGNGGTVRIAVRPERIEVIPQASSGNARGLPCVVETLTYLGSDQRLILRTSAGNRIVVKLPTRVDMGAHAAGDAIMACWGPEEAVVVAH
jgi:spermidine/putrescine ABC transporter ATP-binding subunit